MNNYSPSSFMDYMDDKEEEEEFAANSTTSSTFIVGAVQRSSKSKTLRVLNPRRNNYASIQSRTYFLVLRMLTHQIWPLESCSSVAVEYFSLKLTRERHVWGDFYTFSKIWKRSRRRECVHL